MELFSENSLVCRRFNYLFGGSFGNLCQFDPDFRGFIWGKMLHDEFLGDVLGGANFLIMEGELNHYVSDMVMGYLLGKAIGNYVWAQHAQDDLTSSWVLYPIYLTKDDTYFGCGLLRQF